MHDQIKALSDDGLLLALGALAKGERCSQVEILMHLAELDERKLYLAKGYGSMWDFCRRALRFSESVAHQRIAVARICRRFPEVLAMLADGRLSLCTAADLGPALTDGNAKTLLAQASGLCRREVQALADTAGAKPKERDVIRRIAPKAEPPLRLDVAAAKPEVSSAIPPATEEARPASPKAVEARHRVAFTASDEVVKKLDRIKELTGAKSIEEAVDRAAEALLDRVDPARREARRRKRRDKTPKAKTKPVATAKEQPRRPPLPVRDQVAARDGGRCAYVSEGGVRCAERRHLEVDHIQPYSRGGTSTDQRNLRQLCSRHHALVTRQEFGPWMGVRQAKGKVGASAFKPDTAGDGLAGLAGGSA